MGRINSSRLLKFFLCLSLAGLVGCSSGMLSQRVSKNIASANDLGEYEVAVENYGSTVTLDGLANSDLARQRIEQIARNTEGVQTVRNNLRVSANSRGNMELGETENRYMGADSSGGAVVEEILSEVRSSDRLSSFNVSMRVNGDTATIDGVVSAESEKEELERIASRHPRIRNVENNVTLNPLVRDDAIEQRVNDLIRSTRDIRALSASVDRGMVKLEGDAASHVSVDRLLSDVRMITGVTKIDSQITLNGGSYERNWRGTSSRSQDS